jgi:hypothetical protein
MLDPWLLRECREDNAEKRHQGLGIVTEVGHGKVRDRISIPNVGENGFIERSQISN